MSRPESDRDDDGPATRAWHRDPACTTRCLVHRALSWDAPAPLCGAPPDPVNAQRGVSTWQAMVTCLACKAAGANVADAPLLERGLKQLKNAAHTSILRRGLTRHCGCDTIANLERGQQANAPRLEFRGEARTEAEWCASLGLMPGAIRRRLKAGWSTERAFTEVGQVGRRPADRGAAE